MPKFISDVPVLKDTRTLNATCSSSLENKEELFLEVLAKNVAELPDDLCLAFLDSQGDVEKSFTRSQLWSFSETVAIRISQDHGVTSGQRVMIVFPPGIDYAVAFIACLRLGAIVVSVYPPNPAKLKADIPKFAHFVQDSGSMLALTTKTYKKAVKVSSALGQKWPKLQWIATDDYGSKPTTAKLSSSVQKCIDQPRKASDLALIQYTSGSTGNPKGVMISHGNISHQSNFAVQSYKTKVLKIPTCEVKYIGWVPQYHDLGLFQGFLFPIYGGYMAYNMSPISFLRDPTLWPRALQRYSGHLTCGPNFAYNLACKRTEAARLNIDLSGMLSFTNGGEPLDPRTPDRVRDTWNTADKIFRNAYGQAETTLAVSCLGNRMHCNRVSVGDISHSLSLGHDVRIAIYRDGVYVDAEDGEEGEIWTCSPSVARGYWNKPELTSETFHAKLQGEDHKMYQRSGDAGYIYKDKLFVTTRLKDLIIVNGKNFAPTDIEKCAEDNFAVIRPGCSVAFQPEQEPHAILVCEVRAEQLRSVVLERLANDIRAAIVAGVEIPVGDVVLVEARTVPKTTSGKVQRKKCAECWSKGTLQVLYSTNRSAASTLQQNDIADATSLKAILAVAGVEHWNTTLAANGIDSLLLSQIISSAQKIGVNIPYQDAMQLTAMELLDEYGVPKLEREEYVVELPAVMKSGSGTQVPSQLRSSAIAIRQIIVLTTTLCAILIATVPSAVLTNELWDSTASIEWLWQINGRLGPVTVIAVVLWMLTYTVICVLIKWLVIGRQRVGSGYGYRTWSNGYMRWMIVQNLFGVWEHVCGRFLIDTPYINLIYVLLGARIHPSARIKTFFRDWDLVVIGSDTIVKGLLCPHFHAAHGVVFNTITIGKACSVGAQSVAQAPVKLHDGCTILPCTYLAPHTELVSGTYEGNPVVTHATKQDGLDRPNTEYEPWVLTRSLLPVMFVAFATLATAALGSLLPDVSEYRSSPVWSWEYVYVVVTYLIMYQLVGVCMLLASIILKWSFISPYLTDAFAEVAFSGFLVYLSKTVAIKYWFRLYGMTIGSDTVILRTGVCSPSTAHRVIIGKRCLLVNCTLSPSQGPTVWSWLSGRTESPWWGAEADQKGILIGSRSQLLLRCRVEDNVTIRKACTIAAFTHIAEGTVVNPHTTAFGNPYTPQGDTLMASRGENVKLEGGTKKPADKPDETHKIDVAAGVVSVDIGASVRLESLQEENVKLPTVSPSQRTDSARKQVLPKSLRFMHVVFAMLTPVTLALGAIAILLGLAALPIYSMHYIPRIIFAVLYGLCCLVGYLWGFMWVAKWVLIGTSHRRQFHMNSTLGIRFLYLQALQDIVGEWTINVLFAGTFMNNLYSYSMGANISLLHTQLFTSSIEPADAHYLTMRSGAVLDYYSYASCHRAYNGEIELSKTYVMQNAVLHSCSGILMGSVGTNTQLLPLTMPIRELHMGEDEVYSGAPANLIQANTADVNEIANVVDM